MSINKLNDNEISAVSGGVYGDGFRVFFSGILAVLVANIHTPPTRGLGAGEFGKSVFAGGKTRLAASVALVSYFAPIVGAFVVGGPMLLFRAGWIGIKKVFGK